MVDSWWASASSQLYYLPGGTSLVYTILVQKKITFSAAESDIERAREVARSEHRPLIDAFREWLIQ